MTINVPTSIPQPSLQEISDINLSCCEASLPGSQLATFEVNNDYQGITQTYAHRRMYDNSLSLTFYVDSFNYNVIKLFENWIDYVVGGYDDPTSKQDRSFNRLNYPETDWTGYVSDSLIIKKIEKDLTKASLRYNFRDIYPYSINSMQLSYDSSQLLKCSVQFRYTKYILGTI